jgi:DNA-binding PadR family transcriptional regulator
MTVRRSLLAILDQAPCYGYQLRAEFERRTNGAWPVNIGQVYGTLDRLERSGHARRGDPDVHGHVYWRITAAGRAELATWWATPTAHGRSFRDDMVMKVTLAATLPGVDAAAVIAAELTAVGHRLAELRVAAGSASDLPAALVTEARRIAAEAERGWLVSAAERIAHDPVGTVPLRTDRPRRGRPSGRVLPVPDRTTAEEPA